MQTAKRFYKAATAAGGSVMLDARALKTPAGHLFCAPTPALAEAVAGEWQAQTSEIVPARMPLTQLAFAAIDGGADARAERIAFVTKYGETDLCCHRAETPAELVARQAAAWDDLLAWGGEALGVRLPVVTGVVAARVEAGALEALASAAATLDDFRLTALAHATGLSGSALIGFALTRGRIGAEQAFAASALDDLWSLERWGEDAEARARLEKLRAALDAAARFVAALG